MKTFNPLPPGKFHAFVACCFIIFILSGIPFECPNSLDPEQARQNVGPGLVPNCLQKILVVDDTNGQRIKCYY